jgi:hypothetical protein
LVENSADTFIFGESLEVREFENLSVRIGGGEAVDMTVAPVEAMLIDLRIGDEDEGGGEGGGGPGGPGDSNLWNGTETAEGGAFNDVINVGNNAGAHQHELTVNGGAGNDEINAGSFAGAYSGLITVDGGAGDDKISFGFAPGADGGKVIVDGGAGADTFEFGDNAQNLTIDLGEGDGEPDSVTFLGAVFNATIANWEPGDMVNVPEPSDWERGESSEGSVTLRNGMQSLTFMDTTDVPELGFIPLPDMEGA